MFVSVSVGLLCGKKLLQMISFRMTHELTTPHPAFYAELETMLVSKQLYINIRL